MAKFEFFVIFDPFLSDEDYAAETEKVREQVKRRGGEVTNVDVWGKKRMAYEIAKKIEGYYVLFNIEGDIDGASMTELERNVRLNERVLRQMITRVPVLKPRKVKVKKPKANQGEGDMRPASRESYSAGSAGASAGPNDRI